MCKAAQIKEIFINMLKEMKNMPNSIRSVTNMALPLSFFELTDSTTQEKTCSLPYGAPSNIHDKRLCTEGKIVQPQPIVSIV